MKNYVLVFALLASLCQARFFVGISGGYLGTEGRYSIFEEGNLDGYGLEPLSTTRRTENKISKGHGVITRVMIGTEHFPHTDYIGWRWEIGGGYGHYFSPHLQTDKDTQGSLILAELASDVLINFYVKPKKFSFGIFAGIGLAWQQHQPNSPIHMSFKTPKEFSLESMSNATGFLSFPIRLGFSTLIDNHHRFELYAVLPVGFHQNRNLKITNINNHNVQYFVGSYQLAFNAIQGLFSYKYVF